VAPSWCRLGYAARRHLWSWDATGLPSLDGRVVLVTGGTSGIGRATAVALGRLGATVGLVGRDGLRLAEAVAEVTTATGHRVWGHPADLADLPSVRGLAEAVTGWTDRLDGLVHAAGLLNHHLVVDDDGLEATAAVHVVGPHLLTALLAPLLQASAPSRVVWVSSGGMYARPLDVDHLDHPPTPFRGSTVYAVAKRAQVALAREWAGRLAPSAVAAYAMHPGWVDTGALRAGLPLFATLLGPVLRRPDEGADTAVWLTSGGADADVWPAGGGAQGRPPATFWLDRRPRPDHRWPVAADAPGEVNRLWIWCQRRAGLDGGDG